MESVAEWRRSRRHRQPSRTHHLLALNSHVGSGRSNPRSNHSNMCPRQSRPPGALTKDLSGRSALKLFSSHVTVGEMFTLLRFQDEGLLHERGVHEFDAWAAAFGDTRTELQLQPSGSYKPVERFSHFVNVPELIDMFRAYQKVLARRIKDIEERSGRPQKGDDILLAVITDGRHAAIDMRLVDSAAADEPD